MKTVLVTGATSGFGRACAELFVAKGWQAVVTGRRKERLDELTDYLGNNKAHGLCFNLVPVAHIETETVDTSFLSFPRESK